MTAIYIITHTDPALPSITINPNKVNGPGSVTQDTNLTMYGAGSLQFGEQFNTNFLKLLENFSSPELAGSPSTGVPDPAYFDTTLVQKGQCWFNSTIGKLMVFDGTNWIVTGGASSGTTQPPNPQIGDLWYDETAPQLKVLESTGPDTWVAVALPLAGGTLTGFLTLDADPVNALHAVTKQYVDAAITASDELGELVDVTLVGEADEQSLTYDIGSGDWINSDLFVKLSGSTMTGNLILGNGNPTVDSTRAIPAHYVDSDGGADGKGFCAIHTSTGADPVTGDTKAGDLWFDTNATVVSIRSDVGTWIQVFPAVFAA